MYLVINDLPAARSTALWLLCVKFICFTWKASLSENILRGTMSNDIVGKIYYQYIIVSCSLDGFESLHKLITRLELKSLIIFKFTFCCISSTSGAPSTQLLTSSEIHFRNGTYPKTKSVSDFQENCLHGRTSSKVH